MTKREQILKIAEFDPTISHRHGGQVGALEATKENARLMPLITALADFVDQMYELGQALPPNAISMNIQKRLTALDALLNPTTTVADKE